MPIGAVSPSTIICDSPMKLSLGALPGHGKCLKMAFVSEQQQNLEWASINESRS